MDIPARPSYFRLAAQPQDGLRSLMSAAEDLAAVTSAEGRRRVMLDLRPLGRSLPRTEAVILCHHLGAVLATSRLAVLADQPLPEGETAAKLIGARLRWFVDAAAAAAWLETPVPRSRTPLPRPAGDGQPTPQATQQAARSRPPGSQAALGTRKAPVQPGFADSLI